MTARQLSIDFDRTIEPVAASRARRRMPKYEFIPLDDAEREAYARHLARPDDDDPNPQQATRSLAPQPDRAAH